MLDNNHMAIMKQIKKDLQYVRDHQDEYGEPVNVVGRRQAAGGGFEYKLSDGRIVSNEEAWSLANAHKLKGFMGSHNNGRKYIKTIADGNPDNNITNLDTF